MGEKLSNEAMALRAAKELRPGEYVNLGVGIPRLVMNYIAPESDVILQGENGILGYSGLGHGEEPDPDCYAPGVYCHVNPGAAFFSSSLSFAMIRGGHLDVTILGGYQVSEKGDLANWLVPGKRLGGVGGAMDLVTGAKRVIVLMEHNRKGESKVVKECTLPLTGKGVVNTMVTDMAVIDVTPEGLLLREVAPGITVEEVKAATEAELIISKDLKILD